MPRELETAGPGDHLELGRRKKEEGLIRRDGAGPERSKSKNPLQDQQALHDTF